VSLRRICRVLGIARSTLYGTPADEPAPVAEPSTADQPTAPAEPTPPVVDPLIAQIKAIITAFPTYGYRRVWAILRHRDQVTVNRKKVYRIMRAQRWMITQRQIGPKPRVRQEQSQTERSNERWAMDITHIPCGADGWGHLVAVIDCHDREVIGIEFARRGRAQEAERALEMACLARFGTVRPTGATPVLRSDNGLVFQSRHFRDACQFYRLSQEYITPYTPQQNGLIERFFRSLKEECVWQQTFASFAEAQRAIRDWITWYNTQRPHQALDYRSPHTYRAAQAAKQAESPTSCVPAA
jgi:putative transposase